jgi:hypothetical protein
MKITKAGREAIGVGDEEAQDATSAWAGSVTNKSKKSRSKPTGKTDAQKTSAARGTGALGKPAGDDQSSPADFRAGSKQAKIVEMMKRAKGATLDELVEATDWLPHTTRAGLTGLRKRGLTVERMKDEGRGAVYRIKSERAAKAA